MRYSTVRSTVCPLPAPQFDANGPWTDNTGDPNSVTNHTASAQNRPLEMNPLVSGGTRSRQRLQRLGGACFELCRTHTYFTHTTQRSDAHTFTVKLTHTNTHTPTPTSNRYTEFCYAYGDRSENPIFRLDQKLLLYCTFTDIMSSMKHNNKVSCSTVIIIICIYLEKDTK
jgi:hypothetical protein